VQNVGITVFAGLFYRDKISAYCKENNLEAYAKLGDGSVIISTIYEDANF
jgi:hypothetical protein